MKLNTKIICILNKFNITKTEFYVILLLASGLVIGAGYKLLVNDTEIIGEQIISVDALNSVLDSIAVVNSTTFTGSNIDNEPINELAAADTLIKSNFASQVKKSDFKGVININTASKSQLQQLYRIGAKTADKIIEYRSQKPFRKIEDILKVKGIGIGTFEKIKNNITI